MKHVLDGTIHTIHAALVRQEITPLDLVLEAIQRAKANPNNAFERLLEDEAIAFAKTLTKPEEDNVFWGIPYALKDNFSTKGHETTAGSNSLNGYVPLYDATVVKRLKDVKAILIGKTTLDELAMGGTGMTGHQGIQTNPYDASRSRQVGGSSSGSAIVVADAIVPFAIGSATGDSVRKPASYTGLVGFKPTWGRVSRFGLFPFAPSLDHVAFFTRSVEDARALTLVVSGKDDEDATSRDLPIDFVQPIRHTTQKIAVLKPVLDSISNATIKQRFLASIDALKQRGHHVDIIDFPLNLLQAIYPTYMTISCAEATSNNANLDGIKFGPSYEGKTYQDVMIQARTHGFSELIKRRFVIGSFVLMRENQDVLFLRAQRVRRKIVDALNDVYASFDAIYLPAAPTVAPLLKGSSDRLSNEYLIADSHLALGNFAGLPSITIPLGFEGDLPFGGNVMRRKDEEALCLSLAQDVEGWSGLHNLSTRYRGTSV